MIRRLNELKSSLSWSTIVRTNIPCHVTSTYPRKSIIILRRRQTWASIVVMLISEWSDGWNSSQERSKQGPHLFTSTKRSASSYEMYSVFTHVSAYVRVNKRLLVHAAFIAKCLLSINTAFRHRRVMSKIGNRDTINRRTCFRIFPRRVAGGWQRCEKLDLNFAQNASRRRKYSISN